MTKSRLAKGIGGAWALLLWVSACGGLVASKPTAGGESHFLEPCANGCGGLDCIANLCTRACLPDQSSCGELSPLATCTNASVEADSAAVCDVGCASNADCRTLGESFACVESHCRVAALPETASPAEAATNNNVDVPGAQGATGLPALCSMPFDPGACQVLQRVYAVVDGICVPAAYGGCGGNDNRFSTFEECVATCEGAPRADCSAAADPERVCVECAPTGGCGRYETVCSQGCSPEFPCKRAGFTCNDNWCQPPSCF